MNYVLEDLYRTIYYWFLAVKHKFASVFEALKWKKKTSKIWIVTHSMKCSIWLVNSLPYVVLVANIALINLALCLYEPEMVTVVWLCLALLAQLGEH